MNTFGIDGKYDSISQRIASTYWRMLTDFCPILPDGLTPEQQDAAIASQRDLHAFFTDLYHAIYTAPAQFGLPLAEDTFVLKDHAKEGANKTDVKRILDRPRKQIDDGLDFLRKLAISGKVEGDTLTIALDDPALDFLKKKQARTWVRGMAALGLDLVDAAGAYFLRSEKYPNMMPALQALAQACARCENPNLGWVFFARCDFRALNNDFNIDALDLYRTTRPEDYAWAAEQHAFFTARGYQAQVFADRIWAWQVKYQGKRSIKGSPLFEVDFDERILHQLRAQIKCAAATRIAPLLEKASPALQADFQNRVFNCHDCTWCDSRPHLGPVEINTGSETRKICWYVTGDLDELTPESAALVREYTELHEALA